MRRLTARKTPSCSEHRDPINCSRLSEQPEEPSRPRARTTVSSRGHRVTARFAVETDPPTLALDVPARAPRKRLSDR
jgi:hypothetical protein